MIKFNAEQRAAIIRYKANPFACAEVPCQDCPLRIKLNKDTTRCAILAVYDDSLAVTYAIQDYFREHLDEFPPEEIMEALL